MNDLSIENLFALSEAGIQDALKDLDTLSIEAIMMEMQNYVDELNVSRGFVASVYNRKMAEAEARRKVELMSDEEKAALVQAIQAGGISGDRPVGNQ